MTSRRDVASLVATARRRIRDDDLGTHAAALAYQLFLSTLALSLVALAVLGLVDDLLPFDLPDTFERRLPNVGGGAALGVASLIGLVWTASALSRRASRALAVIFRTGPEDVVRTGLRSLATTFGLIVLIGALPVVTGVVTAMRAAAGFEVPLRVLGLVATAALEFGIFLLAYTALTPGGVGWRAHMPGAAVMTVSWELAKVVGGVLLAGFVSRATILYGTIGTVVGLLLFLRLATGMFVFGAELSAIVRERAAHDER